MKPRIKKYVTISPWLQPEVDHQTICWMEVDCLRVRSNKIAGVIRTPDTQNQKHLIRLYFSTRCTFIILTGVRYRLLKVLTVYDPKANSVFNNSKNGEWRRSRILYENKFKISLKSTIIYINTTHHWTMSCIMFKFMHIDWPTFNFNSMW